VKDEARPSSLPWVGRGKSIAREVRTTAEDGGGGDRSAGVSYRLDSGLGQRGVEGHRRDEGMGGDSDVDASLRVAISLDGDVSSRGCRLRISPTNIERPNMYRKLSRIHTQLFLNSTSLEGTTPKTPPARFEVLSKCYSTDVSASIRRSGPAYLHRCPVFPGPSIF
jgi:hypothetical protein